MLKILSALLKSLKDANVNFINLMDFQFYKVKILVVFNLKSLSFKELVDLKKLKLKIFHSQA